MFLKKLSTIESYIKQKCPKINIKNAMPLAVLVLVLASQSQGWAADVNQAIDDQTNAVMNIIFSPWLKKICLSLGAGVGIFQAWATGSIKPFLAFGSIGLVASFIPKVIDIIIKV